MNSKEIRKTILELSSEDSWGSWELWWNVSAEKSKEDLTQLSKDFIDTIETLLQEKKIIVEHYKKSDNSYFPAEYDHSRLEYEVEHAHEPDPNSFYWFWTTEEGKKEDILLGS